MFCLYKSAIVNSPTVVSGNIKEVKRITSKIYLLKAIR